MTAGPTFGLTMDTEPSLRDELRVATRADHACVERLMALESPALTREAYGAYLSACHAVHARAEPQLRACGTLRALGLDMASRERLPALERDLAWLGLPRPQGATAPDLATPAARLGCAYVLAGASLGAASLYPRIAARWDLGPERGASFLRAYGVATGRMWREFVAALDRARLAAPERAACVASARATFAAMEGAFNRARSTTSRAA